jgi:uncharacterized protein (TIGR02611 family)
MLTGTLKQARRTAIAVVGFTILALGAVMLVTPGPGWLVIFVGLSVLGLEFVWARRMLRRLKRTSSDVAGAIFGKAAPKTDETPPYQC